MPRPKTLMVPPVEKVSHRESVKYGQRRLYRAGAILAVLLGHVLAFQAFIMSRQTPGSHSVPDERSEITWMALLPTAPEKITKPSAAPHIPASQFPKSLTPNVNPKSREVVPSQDSTLNAPNPQMPCALLAETPVWADAHKRCKDASPKVQAQPALPREPTEREAELEKKFSQDKKIQMTPVLLPCFSPEIIGVDPICVVSGIVKGVDFGNAVYPDRSRAPTRRSTLSRYPRTDDMRRHPLRP